MKFDPTGNRYRVPAVPGHGFTLIELVCVIVILGLLSATVLPRFLDLGEDANRASVAMTSGSFGASVSLANAKCLISGWADKDNLPGYGSGTVDFNSSCFPTDTSNANKIGGNATRCMRVFSSILSAAPSITTAASGADYKASAQGQSCSYTYLSESIPARKFTYNSLTGIVTATNP